MALYKEKLYLRVVVGIYVLHRSEKKQEMGLTKNRGKEKNGNNIL